MNSILQEQMQFASKGKEMESPREPIDLYLFVTRVEETGVITATGKSYVKLEGIATRFWIAAPVNLRAGDTVRIGFHKDEHAIPPQASL